MPSISKKGDKYQVQVRRQGQRSLTKSFIQRKDAIAWARQMEVKADKHELPVSNDPKVLTRVTLGELVERYRDEVCPTKRGASVETIALDAFLRHPLCLKKPARVPANNVVRKSAEPHGSLPVG